MGHRGSDDVFKSSPAAAASMAYAPALPPPPPTADCKQTPGDRSESIVADVAGALGVYGSDYASVNPTDTEKAVERAELQEMLKETFSSSPLDAGGAGPGAEPAAAPADADDADDAAAVVADAGEA